VLFKDRLFQHENPRPRSAAGPKNSLIEEEEELEGLGDIEEGEEEERYDAIGFEGEVGSRSQNRAMRGTGGKEGVSNVSLYVAFCSGGLIINFIENEIR